MPVGKGNKMGVGPETPMKQEDFRGIVKIIAQASHGIISRAGYKLDPVFHIFDLHAGEGLYQGVDGATITGSPLIGLEVVRSMGLAYQAVFIDEHLENTQNLAKCIGYDPCATVIHGDNVDAMQHYCVPGVPKHGYVYVDPNKIEIPTALLNQIFSCSSFRRIELIINIAAANVKRVANSTHSSYWGQTLDKSLEKIRPHKKTWIIREPHGNQQWTFIVGSNWVDFPVWSKKGFVDLKTPKGVAIWEKLVHTRDQLSEIEINRVQSRFDFL